MPISDELFNEVSSLVLACLSGEANAREVERLDELVRTDDDACRLYVRLVRDSTSLRQWAASFDRNPAASAPVVGDSWPVVGGQESEDAATPSSHPSGLIPNPSPVLGFLGSAYHGISGYIGDHEWAQGVLGGTVFLALLFAVLGSIEIISRWRQANRPQPTSNQVVDVPAVRAARLTGAYDCRWTGSFRPPVGEVFNVDDYINLASGLAEVTYDSGVKVLLQGPCTYRIESPSSGYLKVGRLTARVAESRGSRVESAKPQAANPKSQIPNPKFVVETPSATVTDLGTEFGVDVDKLGATDSLVFVGSVKVLTVGDGKRPAGEVTLIENQSARVERLVAKRYVVRRIEVKSDTFVRPDQIQDWLAMAREAAAKRKQEAEQPKEPELDLTQFHKWEAFSKELRKRDDLLAYYDFQWDPNDKRDSENHELLRNKAKTAGGGLFGRNYDGQLWGSISMGMIEGRFPGKHAIKFDSFQDGVRVNVPTEFKQLTLVAWVNIEQTFEALPGDCGVRRRLLGPVSPCKRIGTLSKMERSRLPPMPRGHGRSGRIRPPSERIASTAGAFWPRSTTPWRGKTASTSMTS